MAIVDPHHHLWDPLAHDYPWLSGPMHDRGWGDWSALRRPYRIEDLLADARNQDLVKSVHVQANFDPANPVGETAWLDSVARSEASGGFPHGIVAFANLAADDVVQTLEAHARFDRVRGIRQVLNRHPNPMLNRAEHDWLGSARWRDNLGLLARFGWSFDAQVYQAQMPDLASLAARYPDITFIVDHAGMPVERDAASLDGWRKGMKLLSQQPNVVVKLSGYGMADVNWTIDRIRPFVLEPIDCFGPTRAMFASNFPVDRLMADYDRLWNAYRTIVAGFSADEQAALLRGTAERVYRI
ncbi:MAG: amidohydrolase [Lautropia sp.]